MITTPTASSIITSGPCTLKDDHEHVYPFDRDGSNPGADELGPAAFGAEGLLCAVPPETHEVQEGQLAQLPGLQARETRLGLLRTPGVSVYSRVKVKRLERLNLVCLL